MPICGECCVSTDWTVSFKTYLPTWNYEDIRNIMRRTCGGHVDIVTRRFCRMTIFVFLIFSVLPLAILGVTCSSNAQSIVIPTSTVSIASAAYENCVDLRYVFIPRYMKSQ